MEAPLSNIQLELLKLYATGISDKHLEELKDVMAGFFVKKARAKADQIWDKKGYSDETVQTWLDED